MNRRGGQTMVPTAETESGSLLAVSQVGRLLSERPVGWEANSIIGL